MVVSSLAHQASKAQQALWWIPLTQTLVHPRSGDTQVKLFAGLLHHSGSVIGQTQVPDGTTENAALNPLLDQIGDLDGKVITADAAHTNAGNARHVVDDQHGHYLFALKGNQPTAESTVKALPGGSFSP